MRDSKSPGFRNKVELVNILYLARYVQIKKKIRFVTRTDTFQIIFSLFRIQKCFFSYIISMTADHPDRRFPPLVVLLVFSKIALVIIENGAR